MRKHAPKARDGGSLRGRPHTAERQSWIAIIEQYEASRQQVPAYIFKVVACGLVRMRAVDVRETDRSAELGRFAEHIRNLGRRCPSTEKIVGKSGDGRWGPSGGEQLDVALVSLDAVVAVGRRGGIEETTDWLFGFFEGPWIRVPKRVQAIVAQQEVGDRTDRDPEKRSDLDDGAAWWHVADRVAEALAIPIAKIKPSPKHLDHPTQVFVMIHQVRGDHEVDLVLGRKRKPPSQGGLQTGRLVIRRGFERSAQQNLRDGVGGRDRVGRGVDEFNEPPRWPTISIGGGRQGRRTCKFSDRVRHGCANLRRRHGGMVSGCGGWTSPNRATLENGE